jgi:hypothetical protein
MTNYVSGAWSVGGNLTVAGTATGVTPTTGDNSTKFATTAFVQSIAGASFPSGGIIMWSGSIASIPTGWYLCNGTNGTPDLRNKFIVGAGSTYAVAATGGTADAIVVSHTHSVTVNQNDHSHGNVTQYGNPITRMGSGTGRESGTSPNSALGKSDNGSNTDGASADISVSLSSTGSSGTNQNLPPYYALAYIMKA